MKSLTKTIFRCKYDHTFVVKGYDLLDNDGVPVAGCRNIMFPPVEGISLHSGEAQRLASAITAWISRPYTKEVAA